MCEVSNASTIFFVISIKIKQIPKHQQNWIKILFFKIISSWLHKYYDNMRKQHQWQYSHSMYLFCEVVLIYINIYVQLILYGPIYHHFHNRMSSIRHFLLIYLNGYHHHILFIWGVRGLRFFWELVSLLDRHDSIMRNDLVCLYNLHPMYTRFLQL